MTVVEMGWSGIKNGELLALAAEQFECFLTVDTNVERLAAKGPAIRAALANIQPHQFVTISA
jgi:hypothetical protein